MQRVPLFLLHAVLFPTTSLPIKVFETRYLDMVSNCLKQELPFGICLIKSGSEVGEAGEPHSVGTLVQVGQWEMPKPGVLYIEAAGRERFNIRHIEKQGELLLADIDVWPTDPPLEIPGRYQDLVQFLKEVLKEREPTGDEMFEDAGWVSWQLAALLPVTNEVRQRWLEVRDPIMRLGEIREVIERMAEDSPEAPE